MDYTVVDMDSWKRKQHYAIYKEFQKPRYDISFELDITNFHTKIRNRKLSFTTAFIYVVSKVANEIEEFRYRFEDGKVVLYHNINISFAYMFNETELFKNVVVEQKDDLEEFAVYAKKLAEEQTSYFTGPIGNNAYQFSSIPWISYTHITHTDSGKKDNATPIFVWGKFHHKEDRLIMPFSVEAHHAFVDGIHMGKLAEKLQTYLQEYK